MDHFRHIIEIIGVAIDSAGVLVVVLGALLATGRFLIQRAKAPGEGYRLEIKQNGAAKILPAKFLIAGDIIRTVVVAPTLQNVLVLGLIVLIRTFLSLSLQLKIEGKLLWSRQSAEGSSAASETEPC